MKLEQLRKQYDLPKVKFLGKKNNFTYYIRDFTEKEKTMDLGIPLIIKKGPAENCFVCDSDEALWAMGEFSE